MPDIRSNKTMNNITGGVLSPLVRARVDLPIYQKGLELCDNFIVLPQGGGRFRSGTVYVKYTRGNQKATFIPFQFSDQQAYLLELTHFKMRIYKDNGAVLETAKNITAISKANPCQITSNSHGFSNGDEVYITSVAGMTELNGKYFLVAGSAANTFTLTDVFGNAIDSSLYTTYVSGGTVSRVYEIATPWAEAHLDYIQFAQSADTMYLVNQNYEPRKLTRTGHASWTLATYTRTADPFTPSTAAISGGITQANPGVVTAAAHGFNDGDVVNITGVVGMTQVNDYPYVVTNKTVNTFELYDLFGSKVDTTSYTAYSSGGTITKADEWPRAVAFTGAGRLVFASTRANPETIWASKAPSTGTTAYENHTTGTSATDALVFTLSPEFNGKVDVVMWLTSTSKALLAGCYGALRRIYGATEADAITPTGFNAKSVNSYGCAASIPVSNGANMFYIQRADKRVRSLEYDFQSEGYTTIDRNLVSEHLSESGVKRIVEQQSQPDIIWGVKNDGILLGLTFKDREDISGWHRHKIGGVHLNSSNVQKSWGKVLSLGVMPRPADDEQVWLVVERRINNRTVRSVEYFADYPAYPLREDFYFVDGSITDNDDSKEDDTERFLNVLYEKQKDAIHLDMSVSYDGSDYGTSASATLTPASAAVGANVVFTASAAVFSSDMVGRELRKAYDSNGDGGGRARITGYTDSTHVTCEIYVAFDSNAAIPAGSWFLTTNSVTGLDHLEGQTVKVVADGGPKADRTVTNGAITIADGSQNSKIVVGLFYRGIMGRLNIDPGGQTGSNQASRRNVYEADLTFLNTLGVSYGTNPYDLQRVLFGGTGQYIDRPPPPFSGTKAVPIKDSWIDAISPNQKKTYLVQNSPLPCTLLCDDIRLVTNSR